MGGGLSPAVPAAGENQKKEGGRRHDDEGGKVEASREEVGQKDCSQNGEGRPKDDRVMDDASGIRKFFQVIVFG